MKKIQLILLSGGSGKRLWPLSNAVKSKQFLEILQSPDKKKESMIRRIFRQIKESAIDAEVSITTNKPQAELLSTQLGTNTNIIAEPERRDTFPAIALAASYLKYEKKLSDDTPVVVMPVDPYTDLTYFDAIKTMASELYAENADLVLMGIKPTSPSPNFGYIIPEKSGSGTSAKVECFREKPSVENAENFIKDGALWNGGVFAFRLGYIIKSICKYISSNKYDDILSEYSSLPKTSFDYEIVEKARSVRVVKFSGQWKDLGTWNSLCQEIQTPTVGKNIFCDKSDGTHIINELNIPILCIGIEDAVIVATKDGILISRKNLSDSIKNYPQIFSSDKLGTQMAK